MRDPPFCTPARAPVPLLAADDELARVRDRRERQGLRAPRTQGWGPPPQALASANVTQWLSHWPRHLVAHAPRSLSAHSGDHAPGRAQRVSNAAHEPHRFAAFLAPNTFVPHGSLCFWATTPGKSAKITCATSTKVPRAFVGHGAQHSDGRGWHARHRLANANSTLRKQGAGATCGAIEPTTPETWR